MINGSDHVCPAQPPVRCCLLVTRLVSCEPDSDSGSGVTRQWAVRSVRSVKTTSSRLSEPETDSDTEIVDVGAAKTSSSSRPKTAFQAINSRFNSVLAELRQVHLRTMKPASLPPMENVKTENIPKKQR